MRRSISAQSWLSVPPAPALMVRIAFARSCSPPSIFWNSAAEIVSSRASRAARRSLSTSSPASAHSTRTRVSSSCPRRRFRKPRSPSRRFRFCSIFWAPCWSCQKSGADIFCSRRAISAWILASSKVAADVRGPRDQLIEALGNVRAQTHLQTAILTGGGVTLIFSAFELEESLMNTEPRHITLVTPLPGGDSEEPALFSRVEQALEALPGPWKVGLAHGVEIGWW